MPIPSIDPVATGDRPRWSVMLPAWNAEEFLGAALESVLAAGLPPGSQIEVVDDGSTDGTPAVAAAFAERGVAYHRNDAQRGAAANFNVCIRRARGRLVHLLHADDAVLPGFYETLGQALTGTEALSAFARTEYIDERDLVMLTTRSEGPSGIWEKSVETLAISNRIRPPAIVVRREGYEAVGGFREDLHHAADWEMWIRLAMRGPMWFEDRALARYRVHQRQDTSAQLRRAGNITERVAALEMITKRLPPDLGRSALRKGLLYSSVVAGRAAVRMGRGGDWSAARAQAAASLRCVLAGIAGSARLALKGAPSVAQVADTPDRT